MKRHVMELVLKLSALHRLIISVLMGIVIALFCYEFVINPLLIAIFGWIGFAVVFLAFDWVRIFVRKPDQILKKARQDDGTAPFVFFVILLSAFASTIPVLILITSKNSGLQDHLFYIIGSVISMILSWGIVHTQYIFHYAFEYYDEDTTGKKNQVGGLDFPGTEEPDYLDFAYYSFCLGCTFQVSDVDVSSKSIRRITMFHSLLAFFMNTFVVALTINLVAGMSS